MWPVVGLMLVVVAGTIVAPVRVSTTWTVGPLSWAPFVGSTIVTTAGDDGRGPKLETMLARAMSPAPWWGSPHRRRPRSPAPRGAGRTRARRSGAIGDSSGPHGCTELGGLAPAEGGGAGSTVSWIWTASCSPVGAGPVISVTSVPD